MDNRVFDISKPHHSRPDSTGKPVIVGHHPQMTDPMVREHAPDHPLSHQPAGSSMEPLLPIGHMPPTHTAPPIPPVDNFMEQPQTVAPPPPPAGGPEVPPQPTPHNPLTQPGGPTHPPVATHAEWHPDKSLPIPAHPAHSAVSRGRSKKLPAVVLAVAIVLMGAYALVDAGVVGGNINLPFHIFNQDEAVDTTTLPPVRTADSTSLPAGFTAYKLADNDLSFAYPTNWGAPSVNGEQGYTKRGGTNQANGVYAYVLSFATNKDVQVVLTSAQHLPPARALAFYDFQQWCTGTADAKFYKEILRFSSTDGVDTPTTVTCDQGPLADAQKLNDTTIIQAKTTNPDGSLLGDLYTMNMTDNDWPALRVKDATSTNGEEIKKLLVTVKN